MKILTILLTTALLINPGVIMAETLTKKAPTIRIATFNVSMEALNYLPSELGREAKPTGKELAEALTQNHQQIKNIAEIIQRVKPDIILLNESGV